MKIIITLQKKILDGKNLKIFNKSEDIKVILEKSKGKKKLVVKLYVNFFF